MTATRTVQEYLVEKGKTGRRATDIGFRSRAWSIKTPALSQILTAIRHRPVETFIDPSTFLELCMHTSAWRGIGPFSFACRCGRSSWGVTAPMRTDGVKTNGLH